MDSRREKRNRLVAALIILLLTAVSLTIAVAAPPVDYFSPALRIIGLLAVASGLFFVSWLLRGRAKNQPLVFAPQRWVVWPLAVFGLFGSSMVVFYLLTSPENVLYAVHWPVMSSLWIALLFQPENAVAERTASTKTALNDRQVQIWKSVLVVTAGLGVILASVGSIVSLAGDLALAAILLPSAAFFLVIAVFIWGMLRSRRQKLHTGH
jgi:hypothetical protein